MIKGDILEETDKTIAAGYHYIVYYQSMNDDEFSGTFITTEGKFTQNIEMKDEYFEQYDENGKLFKIRNDGSHLACAKLIKLNSWGPFVKVGKLSIEGINFLEDSIGKLEPIVWEDLISTL